MRASKSLVLFPPTPELITNGAVFCAIIEDVRTKENNKQIDIFHTEIVFLVILLFKVFY
jgi:hypothetical protein